MGRPTWEPDQVIPPRNDLIPPNGLPRGPSQPAPLNPQLSPRDGYGPRSPRTRQQEKDHREDCFTWHGEQMCGMVPTVEPEIPIGPQYHASDHAEAGMRSGGQSGRVRSV